MTLAELVDGVDAVIPTPGLPEAHPLFAAARAAGVPVLSEFDLAGAFDVRPLLAVTGTNGKTTVTTMVAAMLGGFGHTDGGRRQPRRAAGRSDRRSAAGLLRGRGVLVPSGPQPVVPPAVATWLNFAEDHLNVHRSLDDYRSAKSRIFADQRAHDTAIVNAEDAVVAAAAPNWPDRPGSCGSASDRSWTAW